MSIEVHHVSKSFGSYQALRDVNLQIRDGELVALLGPSGSGKTTLLRIIAGLEMPDEHAETSVRFHGEDVARQGVGQRRVGFVFQHYALFRHMSVFENIAFGLRVRSKATRPSRDAIRDRVQELLRLIQLENFGNRYPSQLSGGQRQRVALARALAIEPRVLLLDEPFGALDEATREDLQIMLLHFDQENLRAKAEGRVPEYTMLFVTHELNEALYVADRVIGLSRFHSDGHLGATVVYDRPCPIFKPEDPRDFSRLLEQKEELRNAVFDPDYIKQHSEYVSFWDEIALEAANLKAN